jgi:hypothetical protein
MRVCLTVMHGIEYLQKTFLVSEHVQTHNTHFELANWEHQRLDFIMQLCKSRMYMYAMNMPPSSQSVGSCCC